MKMEWSLIVVALVARPAVAQDAHVTEDAHIKRTGKSATSFSIGGYWQANKNCEPTGDPFTFLIEKPPEHGSVCFGRDAVAMHHLVAGSNKKDIEHCGGRSIPGFKVFYQSQAGYSGHDVVQYTVVVHNARQSVLVDLTVLPSESPSKDDFGAPVEEPHQSPGPMPQCSSLVS